MRLVLILILILKQSPFITPIKLSPNGGYDILIGIKEGTPLPGNVNSYLAQIKETIERFSSMFYIASRKHFFINTIDVLLPPDWIQYGQVFDEITADSYESADFRISSEFSVPRVENPNSCSVSGQFIELPQDYFTSDMGFGDAAKALIPQFARFRFGVWEEFGFPGDARFPYFHRAFDHTQTKWTHTGCSDKPLSGEYKNMITGEECQMIGIEPPSEDCRFIPSSDNTVSSSLMHMHWLDSVAEFCDSDTHEDSAPNRQNIYCNHQSVWSVIRSTSDFAKVLTPTQRDSPPPTKFRLVQQTTRPLLYVLFDNGRNELPTTVLPDLKEALQNFFEKEGLGRGVTAALGTYPKTETDFCAKNERAFQYVQELIPFTDPRTAKSEFSSALGQLLNSPTEGEATRDFGRALLEVGESLRARNPRGGAVILIVKTGAGQNSFEEMAHEEEVIAQLKETGNIRVYAIETKGRRKKKPNIHLQRVVEQVGGEHHVIVNEFGVEKKLRPFFGALVNELQDKIEVVPAKKTKILFKGMIQPGQEVNLPILLRGFRWIDVQYTTTTISPTFNLDMPGHTGNKEFSKWFEFNEDLDYTRRITHSLRTTAPVGIGIPSTWTFSVGSCCSGLLVVSGQADPGYVHPPNPQQVRMEVSTSAPDHFVDLGVVFPRSTPFAIYAKVTLDGSPLIGLRHIDARVRKHDGNGEEWTIPLIDNGLGVPDVTGGDGIYSGAFIPLGGDGEYRVSVTLIAHDQQNPMDDNTIQPRLLPIDQEDIKCSVESHTCHAVSEYKGNIVLIRDFPTAVHFINSRAVQKGTPEKILDFSVSPGENFNMYFSWTVPRLYGLDGVGPNSYSIYMSNRVQNSVGHFDNTYRIVQMVENKKPGEVVTFRYNGARDSIVYYVVEAINYDGRELSSGPSNVAGGIVSRPDERPSTTLPPSTSTTPQITTPNTPITFPTTHQSTEATTAEVTTPEAEVTTTQPSSTTTLPSSTTVTNPTLPTIPTTITTPTPSTPSTTLPTLPTSTLPSSTLSTSTTSTTTPTPPPSSTASTASTSTTSSTSAPPSSTTSSTTSRPETTTKTSEGTTEPSPSPDKSNDLTASFLTLLSIYCFSRIFG